MNGCKPWIFNTIQPRRNKENVNTRETNRRQHAIGLPYISKLSKQLARIFKSYDIPEYHKPINTLRFLLVHSKDKRDKVAKWGVVYDIQCPDCNQHCIAETARPLGTRIKEHLAVNEHNLKTGHQCAMRDVKILDSKEKWHRRKIKDHKHTRGEPVLNRELPPVMLQFVPHDVSHVTLPGNPVR